MYFTIFTGIESILLGTSDLGVIVSIELSYAMQHKGRRESGEVLHPLTCVRSMPHGDAAQILMHDLTKAWNRRLLECSPHYLMLRE